METDEKLPNFSIIVAATSKLCIGKDGNIPWPRLQQDMKHFFKTTTTTTTSGKQNAVIMGRKTWESLKKPLPKRLNIILTRNPETAKTIQDKVYPEKNVITSDSLSKALRFCSISLSPSLDQIFVIGGAEIIQEALLFSSCKNIYLTQILKDFPGDTYLQAPFPCPNHFQLISEQEVIQDSIDSSIWYQMLFYRRIIKKEKLETSPFPISSIPSVSGEGEKGYLQMLQRVLDTGVNRPDRTKIGTISRCFETVSYDLTNHQFPLITTKKVNFKAVAAELIWILKGQTNSKILSEQGVKIWDPEGSRENLDNKGFKDRKEGDCGPIYGHQLKHFGAPYIDAFTDYSGLGVNQLQYAINLLKTDPTSRRIIVCHWNPIDLPQMVLPPCHVLYQFYVENGKLSCILYQRSGDLPIGVPYNIASYALLTYLVAHECKLAPERLYHIIADAHIYLNQRDLVKVQIQRKPKPPPKLKIASSLKSIWDVQLSDLIVSEYDPDPPILFPRAV
jgi:dihydrofolate reductase/thymidylate synthase